MRRIIRVADLTLAVSAVAVVLAGVLSLTTGTAEAGSSCHCSPKQEPVLCSNGQIYSNICLARCAGAQGCVTIPVDPRP